MTKSLISLLTIALLTWEFYGFSPPRVSFFDLDASLPIVAPIQAATQTGLPGRYITQTPLEILTINTPRPYIKTESIEPGMSDETEQQIISEQTDEPGEVTLKPGAGTSFLSSGVISIHNETKIKINMDKVMARKLTIEMSAKKPQILIVHTHGLEKYWDGGDVIGIGDRLTELLSEQGFNVIHDRTAYDAAGFNKAYSNALKGITKQLTENPGIQIVLDIHRDSIQAADGTVKKPVTMTDGKKAAQLMFVVGTNNSGLPHDNWPQNLALAVAFQKQIASELPELMRPINLRRERFNQHTTKGSLILEVGAYGNLYEEALSAIELFAKGAGEIIKELVK